MEHEVQKYTVTINGREASVTVKGETIELDNGSFRENHSLVGLLNMARRGALPQWAGQIGAITQRIEDIFRREREQGLDPHVSYALTDGELFRFDLRGGTGNSANIADLKKQLAQSGRLPRAFDTPRARELIAAAA
ncbi:MAG: hypothetical protein ACRERD_14265 [Candidatus Binatia bacterium]